MKKELYKTTVKWVIAILIVTIILMVIPYDKKEDIAYFLNSHLASVKVKELLIAIWIICLMTK